MQPKGFILKEAVLARKAESLAHARAGGRKNVKPLDPFFKINRLRIKNDGTLALRFGTLGTLAHRSFKSAIEGQGCQTSSFGILRRLWKGAKGAIFL